MYLDVDALASSRVIISSPYAATQWPAFTDSNRNSPSPTFFPSREGPIPTLLFGSSFIIRSFLVDRTFCFGMFFAGVGGSCMGFEALVSLGAFGIFIRVVSISG